MTTSKPPSEPNHTPFKRFALNSTAKTACPRSSKGLSSATASGIVKLPLDQAAPNFCAYLIMLLKLINSFWLGPTGVLSSLKGVAMSRLFIKIIPCLACLLIIAGCGTNKSIMTKRYEQLPSYELCRKLAEKDMLNFQRPWAFKVIETRGDTCEKEFEEQREIEKKKAEEQREIEKKKASAPRVYNNIIPNNLNNLTCTTIGNVTNCSQF